MSIKKKFIIIIFFAFLFLALNALQAEESSLSVEHNVQKDAQKEKAETPTYLSNIDIGAYFQLWYIYEKVENGKRQSVTEDKAVKEASGFSLHRARIYLDTNSDKINGKMSVKLESGTPGLLDAYAYLTFIDEKLEFWAGQMKIPSTYEVATSSAELDFATRSRFSSEVTNWSLSKSTSSISPFTSVQTKLRDLGLGLKGEIFYLKYFFMLGNGLGANLFIGGDENKEFVYTNSFGAYFYGVRLSWDLIKYFIKDEQDGFPVNSFCLGGHYNRNKHNDILYRDTKTVLDIDRESWSVDMQIMILNRIRLIGMYGKGVIKDDIDYNNETDYTYSGWELKGIVEILKDTLKAGFRFDSFTEKNSIFGGVEESTNAYTIGLEYISKLQLQLQLNYKWKCLDSDLNKDKDDDIFTIALQCDMS